ncbi:MAG TPA: Uma2 family endonuclease [Acidisphaera sp.]|nr:Uma2 family endonuclease [Acidisphaera sp.]
MSASVKPLTLEEFLAWERQQPLRYEFDGVQPVAMTGGSPKHARMDARIIIAAGTRLQPPCEVFSSVLKVVSATGRSRYSDVTIACGATDEDTDLIETVVVFEVTSPTTSLTDRWVKPVDYHSVPSIQVYVILDQAEPLAEVFRRSEGWQPVTVQGRDAVIPLPEVGISLPLAELYR